MNNVIHLDTLRARPRRHAHAYVRRCDRCRVPVLVGAICRDCLDAIDAEQDALRYDRLRAEAARLCTHCLWLIQPRARIAVDVAAGDTFHEACWWERGAS